MEERVRFFRGLGLLGFESGSSDMSVGNLRDMLSPKLKPKSGRGQLTKGSAKSET